MFEAIVKDVEVLGQKVQLKEMTAAMRRGFLALSDDADRAHYLIQQSLYSNGEQVFKTLAEVENISTTALNKLIDEINQLNGWSVEKKDSTDTASS